MLPESLSTSYKKDMVPGDGGAVTAIVVSSPVSINAARRRYSSLSDPSSSVSGRSGCTAVSRRAPPVGSMSFASGLTRIAPAVPAWIWT